MTSETDVIVLGVGTSGEDVALRLLAAGLEVVGIEPRLVGGECAYWACLPTKSLVRSANLVQEARRADGLVGQVEVRPDWSRVAARLREEVTGGWDDRGAAARFEQRGGRLVRGYGRFVGPRQVAVDDEVFSARAVVVATGSSPIVPPIPGLADVDAWTTREAIAAEVLPASLVVLGGGAVGCELGQVFARFGTAVTIVEGADRLLPAEEPEASQVLTDALTDEGITVHTGAAVSAVSGPGSAIAVTLAGGRVVHGERLLVATGRRSDATSLAPEAAGLQVSPRGFLEVDGHLRAGDGVWAVGDVTGVGLFTHVALYQANIAVAGVLGRGHRPADYRAVPRVTFTDPEVASVGPTERQAREAGHDVEVVVKEVGATFRGWLHRTGNAGVIKLVVDRSSRTLLGATAVGPHGGEVLGMLCTAVHTRVPVDDLVDVIHPFPTFFGGVGEALGAYGRGLVTVLDPGTEPLVTD